jgi:putative FmdB family regulatory protein
MPIYAFECTGCGHHFERLQRLSDADPSQCPECRSETVRRQLTAPSFRLAGGGWYETDFKKDGKKNLADKGEAPKPEAAKPAAAEPSKPATPPKAAD